jgi:type 1 fimbriae regulatory protein FimB
MARTPRPTIAFLSPVEVLSVLRAAKDRSVRDWAILLVAYLHACRASELCNLTLDDVNLRTGSIFVRRLKGSLETTQPLYPHRGEPLMDEIKALKMWLKVRPDDGSAFLFNSQKGGRLSRSQVFRIFQQCAKDAGITPGRTFIHILKHSRASHLVGKMDVALVKQTLGHKALSSTMVYAHVRDEDAAKEARRVTMMIF